MTLPACRSCRSRVRPGRLRSAIVTARKNGVHEVPAFGAPYRKLRRQSVAHRVVIRPPQPVDANLRGESGDPASIALLVGIAILTPEHITPT